MKDSQDINKFYINLQKEFSVQLLKDITEFNMMAFAGECPMADCLGMLVSQ